MNKRLVWNFEIAQDGPLQWPEQIDETSPGEHWESRFFWPDDHVVTLHGLSKEALALSRYKIKHKQDTYYLLPTLHYNLKVRHNQLFYKPILEKKDGLTAYGKKINLDTAAPNQPLLGCKEPHVSALMARLGLEGTKMTLEKEILTYSFQSTPSTTLELTWLTLNEQSYFSVCVESRAMQYVESITRQLLPTMEPFAADYVTFLNRV